MVMNMNSVIIETSFLLLVALAQGIADSSQQDGNSSKLAPACEPGKWRQFKMKFSKQYARQEEESRRRAIFCANLRLIDEHNSNPDATYELGVNQFVDKTHEELARLTNGVLGQQPSASSRDEFASQLGSAGLRLAANLSELPESLDWSADPRRVTAARNQGDCGSCWAFGIVGMLEGQEKQESAAVVELSEQNVLDCGPADFDCNGGEYEEALQAVRRRGGVMRRAAYPYESGISGRKGACRMNRTQVFPTTANLGRIVVLPEGDESTLMKTLAEFGPIAVVLEATDKFKYYKSGVYSDTRPGTRSPNHGVLLVGYGRDAKTGLKYWKIKNSWSEEWGERGFGYLLKDKNNNAGIADRSVIVFPKRVAK